MKVRLFLYFTRSLPHLLSIQSPTIFNSNTPVRPDIRHHTLTPRALHATIVEPKETVFIVSDTSKLYHYRFYSFGHSRRRRHRRPIVFYRQRRSFDIDISTAIPLSQHSYFSPALVIRAGHLLLSSQVYPATIQLAQPHGAAGIAFRRSGLQTRLFSVLLLAFAFIAVSFHLIRHINISLLLYRQVCCLRWLHFLRQPELYKIGAFTHYPFEFIARTLFALPIWQ